MKKFKAEINVMPLEALLDPQGKAVTSSLNSLSIGTIANVRVGKHMSLFVEARHPPKKYRGFVCLERKR